MDKMLSTTTRRKQCNAMELTEKSNGYERSLVARKYELSGLETRTMNAFDLVVGCGDWRSFRAWMLCWALGFAGWRLEYWRLVGGLGYWGIGVLDLVGGGGSRASGRSSLG